MRFCSFVGSFVLVLVVVGSSNLVVVKLFLAEGQSVQSRDPASGTERLPFPPPHPHRDSGENPVQFPQSPVRAVGRPTRAGPRHEPVDHAGERGVTVAKDPTTRSGKSRLPFLLGFCVIVCGGHLSVM